MRKIYLTILSVIGIVGFSSLHAQVSGYTFSASSGTYTPLSGGTDVDAIEADSQLSSDLPIGFTFNFDGNDYTTFRASSNGIISFGTSTSSQTTNDLDGVGATARPLIAPLWDDNDGSATGGSQASYLLSGTAPNRVLTFEWLNWEWRYNSSDPVLSFQVKLYETSNVVEFVYSDAGGAVASGSASIGLSGITDFLSLDGTGTSPNVSSTIETSSISTKPAEGQTYTFTPPSCVGPNTLSVSNLTATSADMNWVDATGSEWEVVYDLAGFTPMPTNNTVTSTTTGTGTLTPSTDYEFYVRSICAVGDTSAWVGPYAFSTPCLSQSIPWTEDFEGLSSFGTSTFPDCWFKENGTWQTSDNAASTYDANALSGQYFLRNRYGNTNSFIWTAGFDLTAGESYDFTFWWAGDGYSGWGGDVFVNTDQTSTGATQIGGSFVTSGETTSMTYQQELYRFQAPTTGTYYFAIRINSNYTPWDISFDDFGLDVTPPCPDPSYLVATWVDNDSVVVTWTEGYLETDWNVELGLPGFTPGTGSEIYSGTVSTDATDTIGGLTQLTDYEVYVQADCGGGDMSTWVGPLSFTTNPNCTSPTMFTASSINADSVELSWTAGGAETEWAIEYGPSGFTPGMGSGTIVSTSGNPTDTITGLGLSQIYDFYLVGLCSPTDSSLWVGPATVTMPLGNDDACDAIELPVDGMTRTFTTVGSTSQGLSGENSSTWFYFIHPSGPGVTASFCGSSFDTKIYAYDRSDCSNTSSFTLLASNDDYCGLSSQIDVCGSPGDTIAIMATGYSSSETGTLLISFTEINVDAGIDGTANVCSSDSVNLNEVITLAGNFGYWEFNTNPNAIYNDSLFIASSVPTGTQTIYHVVTQGCASDTSMAELTIYQPGNSGTAVSPFTSCNSDVYLPDGLEGVVEAGGTWTDDSNTGLLAGPNNNVFVAGSAPAGNYPFTYTVDNGICPAASTSISVTITDCSGIDEIGNAVSLYPNPNDGDFLITSEESGENKVTITDISGKVIFNKVINLTASQPYNISLENAEAGMYMVNISNANGSKVLNVIIK